MKRYIIALLICFIFVQMPLFAEDQEAVILEEGLEAYDDFLDIDEDRWTLTTDDWTTRDNSYGTYIRNGVGGSLTYAYQPFDYNNGDLRSNYYRFKVKIQAYDNDTRSGFVVSENLSFSSINKLSIVKQETKWQNSNNNYNLLRFYMDNKKSDVKLSYNSDAYYYYEVIMNRIGFTNNFDVVINVYDWDNNLLTSKSETSISFSSIYPTLWVESNKAGYFNEFEAYRGINTISNIAVDSLYQSDEKVYMDWHPIGESPDEVRVYYSNDNKFDIGLDTFINISDGGSTTITEEMKTDGYFIFVGKKDGHYGEETSVFFEYLSPISNFKYVTTNTANKYKFTWEPVDGVELFELKYGATSWLDNDQLTATLENISDPTSVSLRGHKASYGNGVNSTTNIAFAQKGNHSAVENFDATLVSNSVDLSWSEYPEATGYNLYKENDSNSLFKFVSNLNLLTYSDPLSDNFLRLGYNIKAVIAGEESIFTTTISIGNRVKNLNASFNDVTSQVELTWDGITSANKYKIFKSESSDMSGATIHETTTNSFNFTFDKNDKNNKFIQVQAYYNDAENVSNNIYADKTEIYTIDYSRNNALTGITPTYLSNTTDVNITWHALAGATAYDIWVGPSPSSLQKVGSTNSDTRTFAYRIKNADASKLYVSVQGINPENAYVLAQAVPVETFTKDVVQNLSVNYDGSSKKAELRWTDLSRADSYIIYYGETSIAVTGDTASLSNIDLGTTFTIKAVKKESSDVYSTLSSPVEAIDADYDVEIKRTSGSSTKTYGQPLELDVDIDINKPGVNLKEVSLEYNLKNVVVPGTSTIIASYIYPEVISVEVIDSGNVSHPVDFLTTVTTGQTINGIMNANGGYSMLIEFSDIADNYIETGSTIRVKIKSDIRFNDMSGGINSILYIDNSNSYAQLELPFHIEGRITALENRIGAGTFIQDAARLDVVLSYKTSTDPLEVPSTKYQLIEYSFKNKQLIIGE